MRSLQQGIVSLGVGGSGGNDQGEDDQYEEGEEENAEEDEEENEVRAKSGILKCENMTSLLWVMTSYFTLNLILVL